MPPKRIFICADHGSVADLLFAKRRGADAAGEKH